MVNVCVDSNRSTEKPEHSFGKTKAWMRLMLNRQVAQHHQLCNAHMLKDKAVYSISQTNKGI